MFTRGRLVPRQPRAIKRTTRTELRGESIYNVKYIHWNIDIISMALRHCNVHNIKYIHCNTGITPTALHHENICNGKYIHLNIGITPKALYVRIFIMANELIGGGDDVDN